MILRPRKRKTPFSEEEIKMHNMILKRCNLMYISKPEPLQSIIHQKSSPIFDEKMARFNQADAQGILPTLMLKFLDMIDYYALKHSNKQLFRHYSNKANLCNLGPKIYAFASQNNPNSEFESMGILQHYTIRRTRIFHDLGNQCVTHLHIHKLTIRLRCWQWICSLPNLSHITLCQNSIMFAQQASNVARHLQPKARQNFEQSLVLKVSHMRLVAIELLNIPSKCLYKTKPHDVELSLFSNTTLNCLNLDARFGIVNDDFERGELFTTMASKFTIIKSKTLETFVDRIPLSFDTFRLAFCDKLQLNCPGLKTLVIVIDNFEAKHFLDSVLPRRWILTAELDEHFERLQRLQPHSPNDLNRVLEQFYQTLNFDGSNIKLEALSPTLKIFSLLFDFDCEEAWVSCNFVAPMWCALLFMQQPTVEIIVLDRNFFDISNEIKFISDDLMKKNWPKLKHVVWLESSPTVRHSYLAHGSDIGQHLQHYFPFAAKDLICSRQSFLSSKNAEHRALVETIDQFLEDTHFLDWDHNEELRELYRISKIQ